MEQTGAIPNQVAAKCEELLPSSPVTCKTPMKKNEFRQTVCASYHNNVGPLTVIPNHMTPPSGLTKFIARNPFDADLTNRLHLSVISPTVFSKVSPKNQDSPFAWTIDELAIMKPAKIEEFPLQQAHCTDPEIEIKAQEAINKFFSQNSIHPSPWNDKKEPMKPLICMTPTRKIEGLVVNMDSSKSTRDCWSQTVLSLPPELPKSVEDALTPYFTFTQNQNVENDDANLSNNSLRRKLFFNHDESTEDESSLILSPINSNSSPPQSGMFAHGTPVSKGTLNMQRTYGTPCTNSRNLTPPNMSPICHTPSNMSCQSIRSRCRSATRLNFSAPMSVDTSFADNNDVDETRLKNNIEDAADEQLHGTECKARLQIDETIEMVSLLHEITPNKEIAENRYKITKKLKDAVDWYRNVSDENYSSHRNITPTRYAEQSGTFSSNQDTGYQTYSMNNTTSNPDNRSMTPSKKAFNWNERINGILEIDESNEKGLRDWQENIECMISSTPSKHIRPKKS